MSTSTALMPAEAPVSPDQSLRILPIHADLLPGEITSGRNARRTRFLLIGAVVLVAVVMGGWYAFADMQRDLASDDVASVTEQADKVRGSMRSNPEYTSVTKVITERDEITADLKVALAKDLPWYTLMDALRAAATKKGGSLTTVTASLPEQVAAGSAATDTIGTLQISGTAKDKATVANVTDALAGVEGVSHVYLTAVGGEGSKWTFTLTAAIDKDYVCGRYSIKTCGSK
jgi:hypothetical protein